MKNRHTVMQIKFVTLALMSSLLLLGACSTPKNIAYFQDITEGMTITPSENLDIKVRPDDKLSIMVTTQDPALSTLFNLVETQSKLGSTNSLSNSGTGYSDGSVSLYTVNSYGDIKFPVLGTLHIAGMTRGEVADYIEKRLIEKDMVKDPIVTVEFANTGISVLGEVNKPGRYEFNRDKLTIVDALAMAGDLTATGQRENVIVLREVEPGKQQAYRVDLTDMTNLASSPVYYLQQNDAIYVEPNNKKKRDTTASGNSAFTPSFWVSIGSLAVTVATLVITLTR